MTVTVTRTKAEQAYTELFEAAAAKLPGTRAIAEARKAAIGAFAGLGLPHRRIEEWKYTDLRSMLKEAYAPAPRRAADLDPRALDAALGPLAALDTVRLVFVDGAHVPALSRLDEGQGKTYRFDPLARGLAEGFDWLTALAGAREGPKGSAMVALNTAFMTDGALLRIVEGARLARPIHIVFATGGAATEAVATRNAVEIGTGAEATIMETHVGLGAGGKQINAVTELAVRDRASVRHVKTTVGAHGPQGAAGSAHVGTWLVKLGARCEYRAFQLTAGAPLVRNQVWATFNGEGARLDISGAFLAGGAEHVDTTLVVDHAVPGCESRELFKGVLADRARGVFQGKVIVRPDAQKTDGKQMVQVLMLSEDAEFDSKPELEIHADDVICGHGSTSAEIDPDMLFYLRSRGIPPEAARAMLIQSFVGEALDKIEHEAVRGALAVIATGRLAGVAA
jgi:Fe-S cluster assembly protein SufD